MPVAPEIDPLPVEKRMIRWYVNRHPSHPSRLRSPIANQRDRAGRSWWVIGKSRKLLVGSTPASLLGVVRWHSLSARFRQISRDNKRPDSKTARAGRSRRVTGKVSRQLLWAGESPATLRGRSVGTPYPSGSGKPDVAEHSVIAECPWLVDADGLSSAKRPPHRRN